MATTKTPTNPPTDAANEATLDPGRSLGTRNLSGRIHESSPVLRWEGGMVRRDACGPLLMFVDGWADVC